MPDEMKEFLSKLDKEEKWIEDELLDFDERIKPPLVLDAIGIADLKILFVKHLNLIKLLKRGASLERDNPTTI
jgi:hypothetical protein